MSSVVLADIYLAQDRQTIAGETAALLAETAELMEKESGWSLQLEAHCDDRGTAAYGLVVGEERVRKIKTILKDMGVLATQLMSTSYGLEQPLCGEATSMCWEENLRTMWAIRLLDYDHSQTGCLVRLRLVTPQNFARALRYSRTKPFLQRIQYAEPSISFVYEGQESSSFFGNR
jgi:hypothetical protein